MSKKNMLCMLFVFVMLAMLALAVAGGSRFPLVNKAVTSVVLPVESGFTTLGHAGDSIKGYWQALTVLQSENEQLKKENMELREANIRMASIYAENGQLRSLLNYKEQHKDQKLVAAKVIARNFGDLRDCIYIDAGEDKGVQREMAVVNDGLVGIVDEVYGKYARVLLITSPRCRVGAQVLRAESRAVGTVGGRANLGGKLLMDNVYREASLNEGDIVVTSAFSGSYPQNILIGKITSKRLNSVGLLQEAEIEPSADVADVEHVQVVTGFAAEPKIEVSQGGQAK